MPETSGILFGIQLEVYSLANIKDNPQERADLIVALKTIQWPSPSNSPKPAIELWDCWKMKPNPSGEDKSSTTFHKQHLFLKGHFKDWLNSRADSE